MALKMNELVVGIVLLVLAATSAAGSWSGYVVEQGTNIPVDSATASAAYASGAIAGSVLTDAAGFFNITGLSASGDVYTLNFQKTGWTATSLSGLPPLSATKPDRTFNPALMNVTMTRALPATVTGTVSNATGLITGVTVTIEARQGATVVASTTTTTGTYAFSAIDGTYDVTASAANYNPQSYPNAVLAPNSTQTINFVLTSSVVLTGVSVTPATLTLAPGATQQFAATATYSDNSTAGVTASAAWTSSNATVASVSATGLVTALVDGTTTVQASYGGRNGQSIMTVSTVVVPTPTPGPSGGSGGGTYVSTPTPTPTPNATVTPTAAPTATPAPTANPVGTLDTQQYSVKVGVNSESYEFLVSRQLVIESDPDGGYRTAVVITIKSKGKTMTDFEFKELIPSAFGQPSAMTYLPQPSRLTSDGAVWKFSFLNAGDVLTLKYSKKGITPKSYSILWGAPTFYSTKQGVTAVTQVVTLPTPTQAPSETPSASPVSQLSGFFTAGNTQYVVAGAVVAAIAVIGAVYVIKFKPKGPVAQKEGLRGAAKLKHEEKLRKLADEAVPQSKQAAPQGHADRRELVETISRIEQELEGLKKQL